MKAISLIMIGILMMDGCAKNPTGPEESQPRSLPTMRIVLQKPMPPNFRKNVLVVCAVALTDSLDIPASMCAFVNAESYNPRGTIGDRCDTIPGDYLYWFSLSTITPKIDSVTIVGRWTFSQDSLTVVAHF
jgi:hypothetical protein